MVVGTPGRVFDMISRNALGKEGDIMRKREREREREGGLCSDILMDFVLCISFYSYRHSFH